MSEQSTEHRMRLSTYEITFVINCLKELENSHREILAMSQENIKDEKQKALTCFYNQKITALNGLIRRYESIREGGKRQLRDIEKIAVRLVVNQQEQKRLRTEGEQVEVN